jgi:hypothetical protein
MEGVGFGFTVILFGNPDAKVLDALQPVEPFVTV